MSPFMICIRKDRLGSSGMSRCSPNRILGFRYRRGGTVDREDDVRGLRLDGI